MKKYFTSLDSCRNVIISMEGGSPKASSLEVLHNKCPHPEHNVLDGHDKVHLTQAGHPGLLVRQQGQLVIGEDSEGKLCGLVQSDVGDIGTSVQSDVETVTDIVVDSNGEDLAGDWRHSVQSRGWIVIILRICKKS